MPAYFQPPVWNVIPPVLPETRGPQARLFRHYGPWPRGRSVLFVDGHYAVRDNPTSDDIENLTEGVTWFQGGRSYVVDDDIAALLEADLFTPDPVTWSGLAGTWDSYSSDTWGTIA